jgi:hypothetical protein
MNLIEEVGVSLSVTIMKAGIATTIIGAGKCAAEPEPR